MAQGGRAVRELPRSPLHRSQPTVDANQPGAFGIGRPSPYVVVPATLDLGSEPCLTVVHG